MQSDLREIAATIGRRDSWHTLREKPEVPDGELRWHIGAGYRVIGWRGSGSSVWGVSVVIGSSRSLRS